MSMTLTDRFDRKPFNFLSVLCVAALTCCTPVIVYVLVWSNWKPNDKIGIALFFTVMLLALSLMLIVSHFQMSQSLAETEDAKRSSEWLADALMGQLLDMLPRVSVDEIMARNRKHRLISAWTVLLKVDPSHLSRASAIELARQLDQRWPALVPEITDGEWRHLIRHDEWLSILDEVHNA